MMNFDELDHISAVYFMSRGQKLYTDIIITHFPFPYFWAYLFSPFWTNFPFAKAITNLHFSLVFFYLLVFIPTFFALKKPKFKLIFSLFIVFLSLLLSLYHGNLYLSETFTGILISAVFWLLLPVLIDKEKISLFSLVLLIIFSSLAAWTQPLFVLLVLIPLILVEKKDFFKTFFSIFILNLIPLIYFAFSGQLLDFFKHAILLNSTVYSKTFPEQINNQTMFIQNITDFFKHEFFTLTHFSISTQIYQFILNLSLLIFSFLILLKSKFSHKIIFLILFFSLMSRQVKVVPGKIFNFGSFPILLFSFICLLIFLIQKKVSKFIPSILIFIVFIFSIKDFSPIFKQSLNPAYNYHVFWSYRENIGQTISALTKPTEKILVYPNDPDLYFFSHRLSIDGFTYWFPWYDQIPELKQRRLTALKLTPPPIIYLGGLDYKNDSKYYGSCFPDLLKNYFLVYKENINTNIWIRSDLTSRIQSPYSLVSSLQKHP